MEYENSRRLFPFYLISLYWLCVFQKSMANFEAVLLEYLIEQKPLISEELCSIEYMYTFLLKSFKVYGMIALLFTIFSECNFLNIALILEKAKAF